MKSVSFILLILCFVTIPSVSHAQEIRVKSFYKLDKDLLARIQPRLDLNDNPCSIIRVVAKNSKNLKFEGNIIGEPLYFTGEALVYVPKGSKRLIIKSDDYGVLRYEFPEQIGDQAVYEARLNMISSRYNKWQGLVMPLVGCDGNGRLSYGLMLGFVKRTGGYLKVKTNFSPFKFSNNKYPITFTINDGVAIDAINRNEVWLSGDEKHGDFSITGGVIQRIWKPIFIFSGLGYGVHERTLSTIGGIRAESQNDTFRGLDAEIGAMFRFKGAALSIGIESNSFKYSVVNLGVGYLF